MTSATSWSGGASSLSSSSFFIIFYIWMEFKVWGGVWLWGKLFPLDEISFMEAQHLPQHGMHAKGVNLHY